MAFGMETPQILLLSIRHYISTANFHLFIILIYISKLTFWWNALFKPFFPRGTIEAFSKIHTHTKVYSVPTGWSKRRVWETWKKEINNKSNLDIYYKFTINWKINKNMKIIPTTITTSTGKIKHYIGILTVPRNKRGFWSPKYLHIHYVLCLFSSDLNSNAQLMVDCPATPSSFQLYWLIDKNHPQKGRK